MKTFRCCLQGGQFLVLSGIILFCGRKVLAQTADSNLIPVVTVQATERVATENSPGAFTVFRTGNTNDTLNVWYDLGGTASNGVDYAMIPPHLVTIDAGATSSTIVITPLGGMMASVAQMVVLTLTNSPLLNPVNYAIGSPSRALVYVETSSATNLPPTVNLVEPGNGAVFYTPTNVQMLAKADDPDGTVTNVEFFAGTTDLGPGLPVVLDPPGASGVTGLVYLFNWLNPSPGDYPLSAVATDNAGASTVSDAVNISVLQGPPTNPLPVVRIISPADGATFFAPVNIPLFAYVNYPTDSTVSVAFFDGTNNLGSGQSVLPPVAASNDSVSNPFPPTYPTNLFFLVWTNPPLGNHILTARALIYFRNTALVLRITSAPVNITVLASPPSPTNRPPIVSIVATDPVAIEGTNSWTWRGETSTPPTWAAWPTAVFHCFTNSGPKTATFAVRRFGDISNDLAVTYDIGGTASNGVDFVALPGFVTIPAGERRAFITIVPIDDGPPDVNKTVVLTLTPSTNAPPDYLLGFPRRAAAIIIDQGPCLATGLLPDGCFHLTAPGPDAAWFSIEYSTNMNDWTPICTNQVINGSIDFVDPDAQSNPSRFYRAVPLDNPPSE